MGGNGNYQDSVHCRTCSVWWSRCQNWWSTDRRMEVENQENGCMSDLWRAKVRSSVPVLEFLMLTKLKLQSADNEMLIKINKMSAPARRGEHKTWRTSCSLHSQQVFLKEASLFSKRWELFAERSSLLRAPWAATLCTAARMLSPPLLTVCCTVTSLVCPTSSAREIEMPLHFITTMHLSADCNPAVGLLLKIPGGNNKDPRAETDAIKVSLG